MKKTICSILLAGAAVAALPAHADHGNTVLGAAIGGATGAVIGREVAGRDGVIIGAAIGGATGAAVGRSVGERRYERVVEREPVYVAQPAYYERRVYQPAYYPPQRVVHSGPAYYDDDDNDWHGKRHHKHHRHHHRWHDDD